MTRTITVKPSGSITGTIKVPGDKSISHRCVMFSAFSKKKSRIRGFLNGTDCKSTVEIMRQLGALINQSNDELVIKGPGLRGFTKPAGSLYCDNSGTTMRLMAGILAGQKFKSRLTGTDGLSARPMSRIIKPLELMGTSILSCNGNAPLEINGLSQGKNKLKAIKYEMPVASAQLKSAIILAGLFADDTTTIVEKGQSRDHSEKLLGSLGCDIEKNGLSVTISPPEGDLMPLDVDIPGDMSSAAFWLAAAVITPDSELQIENVGINPTRDGFLRALIKMGADITLENLSEKNGEKTADLICRHSNLKGSVFSGDEIVRMIDEIPILALAATRADGVTQIKDAAELKVKETNRIATTVCELKKLGANIYEKDDGMLITGSQLTGSSCDSHNDHRLALMLSIAGLIAEGETRVGNAHVTKDSYPGFFKTMLSLGVKATVINNGN